MNRIPANFIRAMAYLACLFLACGAWGASTHSGNAYPVHVPRPWLPCEGSVSLQAGLQVSRLRATSEFRALLEPTPAEDRAWVSPWLGGDFSLRWRPGFTLAFSPRRETFGLRTIEDTVSFQGNPYPHTLKARTELAYNVLPLMAGMGWFPGRQHFQVQLGVYRAYYDHGGPEWIADGEPYGGHPGGSIKASIDGWMLAGEYGFRLGRGNLDLGIEYQRAGESALDGLKGSVRPEAIQLRLGYAWILWQRPG